MTNAATTATLGGGCFWCVEAVFQDIEGVSGVVSGYAGGSTPQPTYEQVCSETTGHAEVVQMAFEPATICFADLLEVFWYTHDPTTHNRQGADRGSQYRSVIFYEDEEQRQIAEASRSQTNLSDLWSDPIVTDITPLDVFYPAETYHQEFYRRNPQQPYCRVVIDPKMTKFRRTFGNLLTKPD